MQLHQMTLLLSLLSLFTIGEGASRIRIVRTVRVVRRSSSRSSSSSAPVCPTDPCSTNSASCYIKVGERCTGNEDSCTMGAECVGPDQNTTTTTTTTTTTSSTTAVSRCQCLDPVYTADLNKLCVPSPGEIGGVCLLAGGNLTCAATNSFCDNRTSSGSWRRCLCNDGYQRTPDLQCCSAMKLTISGLILIFVAVFVIP